MDDGFTRLSFAEDHFQLCGARWKRIPFYFDYVRNQYYGSWCNRPFAICVDIDGTLFSDHPNFGIFPFVKESLSTLVEKGVHICFITARPSSHRSSTLLDIEQLNLPTDSYTLIMKNNIETPVEEFKFKSRQQLRKQFHVPIVIGDQLYDLSKHDENSMDACLNILMENPYYIDIV